MCWHYPEKNTFPNLPFNRWTLQLWWCERRSSAVLVRPADFVPKAFSSNRVLKEFSPLFSGFERNGDNCWGRGNLEFGSNWKNSGTIFRIDSVWGFLIFRKSFQVFTFDILFQVKWILAENQFPSLRKSIHALVFWELDFKNFAKLLWGSCSCGTSFADTQQRPLTGQKRSFYDRFFWFANKTGRNPRWRNQSLC